MPRLLTPAALLGIAAWGVLTGVSFATAGPDTGREVADRIRPGMTLADAERVIGAPPGDYRLDGDRMHDYFSGHRFPNITAWGTYSGRIIVMDGETITPMYPSPQPPLNEPDGVIDSVDWSPVEPPAYWWRVRSPLAATAAALAGILLSLRVAHGWSARRHGRDAGVVSDASLSS